MAEKINWLCPAIQRSKKGLLFIVRKSGVCRDHHSPPPAAAVPVPVLPFWSKEFNVRHLNPFLKLTNLESGLKPPNFWIRALPLQGATHVITLQCVCMSGCPFHTCTILSSQKLFSPQNTPDLHIFFKLIRDRMMPSIPVSCFSDVKAKSRKSSCGDLVTWTQVSFVSRHEWPSVSDLGETMADYFVWNCSSMCLY